mgnify:CR=1 FL=1
MRCILPASFAGREGGSRVREVGSKKLMSSDVNENEIVVRERAALQMAFEVLLRGDLLSDVEKDVLVREILEIVCTRNGEA